MRFETTAAARSTCRRRRPMEFGSSSFQGSRRCVEPQGRVPHENPPQTPIRYFSIGVCGGFPLIPIQLTSGGARRLHRVAIVLFRFLSLTASGACLTLQVAGWWTVFLVPGWSKARRAVGFLSARGPPQRHALAASVANAPRFARNALRPIGQNGFDPHAPNANHGRMDDRRALSVRRAAVVPHTSKDVLVRWAHTHMKTKHPSRQQRSRQQGSRASFPTPVSGGRVLVSRSRSGRHGYHHRMNCALGQRDAGATCSRFPSHSRKHAS
jgi:hypothetical protein